jgi:ketosteroid isomerase-like protein
MDRFSTKGYAEILTGAEAAGTVVCHPSFPQKFSSPGVAELVRDYFAVLQRLLDDPAVQDKDVRVGEDPERRHGAGWFDGVNAENVCGSLGRIATLAYGDERLSGHFVSAFGRDVS